MIGKSSNGDSKCTPLNVPQNLAKGFRDQCRFKGLKSNLVFRGLMEVYTDWQTKPPMLKLSKKEKETQKSWTVFRPEADKELYENCRKNFDGYLVQEMTASIMFDYIVRKSHIPEGRYVANIFRDPVLSEKIVCLTPSVENHNEFYFLNIADLPRMPREWEYVFIDASGKPSLRKHFSDSENLILNNSYWKELFEWDYPTIIDHDEKDEVEKKIYA